MSWRPSNCVRSVTASSSASPETSFRPLKTTDPKEAQGCLARLEENLRLVERGRLALPQDVELGTFLLSDGQVAKKPTIVVTETLTLEDLVAEYMAVHSNGALEANTGNQGHAPTAPE